MPRFRNVCFWYTGLNVSARLFGTPFSRRIETGPKPGISLLRPWISRPPKAKLLPTFSACAPLAYDTATRPLRWPAGSLKPSGPSVYGSPVDARAL